MTPVKIHRLPHGVDLPLPSYATQGAAGLDICAAVSFHLRPGERRPIPTGFAVAIPQGFELQVRPRSGLALQGITVANAPGTIDADYRGEIKVLLTNASLAPASIKRGDRIAQLVLQQVPLLEWVEVDALAATARGQGGFGSTGQ